MNIKKLIPIFCKTKCLLLAFLLVAPCSLQAWEYVGDDYEDYYYDDDEIGYSPTGDEGNSGGDSGTFGDWFGNLIDSATESMEGAYDGLASLGDFITENIFNITESIYNSVANEAAEYAEIGEAFTAALGEILEGIIGDTNQEFLANWLTGDLPSQITYAPDYQEVADMSQSDAAEKMRDEFYANGGEDANNLYYGSWDAFVDTILDPTDWSSIAMQVGGFAGASVHNNGDGTVTFTITNVAGMNSFFYHLVDNRESESGPMHNVTQTFTWTEPIDPSRLDDGEFQCE